MLVVYCCQPTWDEKRSLVTTDTTTNTLLSPRYVDDLAASVVGDGHDMERTSPAESRYRVSNRLRTIAWGALALLAVVACGGEPNTPTGTGLPQGPTATVTAAPPSDLTHTPSASVAATPAKASPPAPSNTATPISTPAATEFPTATPTSTPVATEIPTATPISTPAATEIPTATPTSTPVAMEIPTATPAEYYTQAVDLDGIRIKASGAVAPEALDVAADIVGTMLAHRPDIAGRMAEAGASMAIIPKDGYITEIPELAFLRGRTDPNGNPYDSFRVRGAGGIPGQTTTVTSEENLLDLEEDKTRFWAEDITVHEWAHAIENLGFDDETRAEWLNLFLRAREAGLWPNAFAMKVDGGREFFAEMSQSYLGVNNEIGGPEELYDEGAGGIRAEIFSALEDFYGPVEIQARTARN